MFAGLFLLGVWEVLAGQQPTGRSAQQLVPVYLADPLQIDTTSAAIRNDLEVMRKQVASMTEAVERLDERVSDLNGMVQIWFPLLLVVNVVLAFFLIFLYILNRSLRAQLKEQRSLRELAISRLTGVEQGLQQLQGAMQKPVRHGARTARAAGRKR
jgi:hypothetical protein